MESNNRIFQVLFFIQSAGFIVLVINYSQNSVVIHTQPKAAQSSCPCEDGTVDPMTIYNTASASAKIRGALSNCTEADIKKRPGVMLLTTTNLEFLDVALNMLISIRKIGICVNTTVIAEDKQSLQYLKKLAEGDPGVHVVMTNSGEADTGAITKKGRAAYFMFLKKRQGYVLSLLEKGYEVLFSDADTFWFRDPFPFFKGDFDMSMMDPASPYPQRTGKAHYCTGFAYIKPNNVTIGFVKAWIEYLKKSNIMDQVAMNNLLRGNKPTYVKVQPLDIKLFPPGPTYYDLMAKKENYSVVVMHAASIRGHPAKVAKFKSSNMWLVNATSKELLAREGYKI